MITPKEIERKTNISEINVAKKTIDLWNQKSVARKQSHIGYYLIDEGKNELYKKLEHKEKKINKQTKAQMYILLFCILTIVISILIA